jgi:repressor LexA
MKSAPTTRQAQVLSIIREYQARHGYPPTQEEIADALGLTWTRAVEKHLQALERKGYLVRGRGARTIHLPEQQQGVPVPLIGTIAAGKPLIAEERTERFITLDRSLVPSGTCFLLRVEGESMRDAGIRNGDLVVVRSQPVAQPGEIVAVLLENEVTVKHFHPEAGRLVLRPANPAYTPITVSRDTPASILGKVTAVIRQY